MLSDTFRKFGGDEEFMKDCKGIKV